MHMLVEQIDSLNWEKAQQTHFFLLSLTLLSSHPSHSPPQKPRKNPPSPSSFFFNYSPYHSYLQSTYPHSLFPLALSPFSSIHCKQVRCQESASKPWCLIVPWHVICHFLLLYCVFLDLTWWIGVVNNFGFRFSLSSMNLGLPFEEIEEQVSPLLFNFAPLNYKDPKKYSFRWTVEKL